MKVSNGINVTHIYQEQLKKAQNKTTGTSFSDMFDKNITNVSSNNVSDAPALKHAANANLSFTLNNVKNSEVSDVDPVKLFEFAAGAVANSPEVREEKVARIKALFDAGQYNISPEAVAEKLWASGVMTASWE